jgi:putative addiction module killer protein
MCYLSPVAEIVEYVNPAGVSPFARWRDSLDMTVRLRVLVSLARLANRNFSAVKGAGAGIFELRVDFGPGYRIYFGKDGERLVILLGGGTKKRQQADIEAAQSCWRSYKRDKGMGSS